MLGETGILKEEFRQRRETLAKKMPANSIALLPGAIAQFRNHDVEYPFRQDSDFYYLTGFCEPDAWFVLCKDQNSASETLLFCRIATAEEERWVGKKTSLTEAQNEFGIDKAFSVTEIDQVLPKLIKESNKIFYPLHKDPALGKRVEAWVKELNLTMAFDDLLPLIHEARLIKSPTEIKLMTKAALISANAHCELMKTCRPQMMEYELEGLFLYECYKNDCRNVAYNSIVAGGENACVLHYTNNNKMLVEGTLLLVDAAAEYKYYAADITRTFPINGKFSSDQKALYELVLKAQLVGIECIKPGVMWNKIQEVVVEILVHGLVELGILRGETKTLIQENAYKKFYMHNSGHWLGLDVHDAGGYKINNAPRKLEPGMILTVEPGIYISPNDDLVDKRWWGIGIRIEDDVLVTKTGYQVLTTAVPKTVESIEALMSRKE